MSRMSITLLPLSLQGILKMYNWWIDFRIGCQLSRLFSGYQQIQLKVLSNQTYDRGYESVRLEALFTMAKLFELYNSDRSNVDVLLDSIELLQDSSIDMQYLYMADFTEIKRVVGY